MQNGFLYGDQDNVILLYGVKEDFYNDLREAERAA